MKLFDILIDVYGKKKNGDISHHAINFCKKNGLDIEKEYDKTTLVLALSKISNSEKREKALMMIMSTSEVKNVDVNILRQENYKTCCKIFHPDNKETGDENVFKFIQEVKYAFWDCDGVVKKEIEYYDWDMQRRNREKLKRGMII